MVAPFTSGRIARSMVRVPGSGTDENADPICQNLGNVSNFAAMIPVPQTLSFNNHNRRLQVKSSFNYKSKLSQVNMPTIEELEKPTSQLPTDTDKLEDFTTDDSPRPLPINVSSPPTQIMDSTAVRSSQVSVSSSPATTPSGDRSRSSRLKRTAREESTEVCDASSPPKRYRITSAPTLNKSRGSAPPTLPQGTANINWVLPTGMLAPNGSNQVPNGSIQFMPIVLPIASGSNMPLAMPMRMVQLNNQAKSVILANGNINGKASAAFVLQANGSNAAAVATPQVPNIQPTPVVIVPTQTLPLLFPSGTSGPNRDLQQMAQERNHLKKENEALKYRLSRFHQLLRNKEQLMTVLKNLEAVQS